jgi:ParB family chromosome partitioning protein
MKAVLSRPSPEASRDVRALGGHDVGWFLSGSLRASMQLVEIDVDKIVPLFPREVDEEELRELAKSLRETAGPIEPIVVRPSRKLEGRYELIAGYRRWRATQLAGFSKIEAKVLDVNDLEAHIISLSENVQRRELSDYEVARMLRRLRDDFGLSELAIAEKIGKSKSWVANHLKMLELEKYAVKAITFTRVNVKAEKLMNMLTEGHARAALKFSEPIREKIVELLVEKCGKGEELPSAREIEELGRRYEEELKEGEEKAEVEESKVKKVEKGEKGEKAVEEVEEAHKEPYESKVGLSAVLKRPEDVDKFFEKWLGPEFLKESAEELGSTPESAQTTNVAEAKTAEVAEVAKPVEVGEVGELKPSEVEEFKEFKAEAKAPLEAEARPEEARLEAQVTVGGLADVEAVAHSINDLLLQLRDVIERLRSATNALIGRKVKAVCAGEEFTGVVERATKTGIVVSRRTSGGALHERLLNWLDLESVEVVSE